MALNGEDRVDCETMRRLTKHEIDRRIGCLVAELVAANESDEGEALLEPGSLRPRWISPEELVRRMRPFLVYN